MVVLHYPISGVAPRKFSTLVMSEFKQLLRQSRVFSLPQRIVANSDNVPSHQALTTTTASHHRRNWGIKYPLPSKAKSVLITHEALDSSISMPEVTYGSAHTRRVQKFNELGLPVQPFPHEEFKSLFKGQTQGKKTIADLSRHDLNRLLKNSENKRPEYLQAVQRRKNESQSEATNPFIPAIAENFVGLRTRASAVHSISGPFQSSFGLSYGLKGTLHNTPEGMVKSHTVGGRYLPSGNTSRAHETIACAGFLGIGNKAPARDTRLDTLPAVSHERVHRLYTAEANAKVNGEIVPKFRFVESGKSKKRLSSVVDRMLGI